MNTSNNKWLITLLAFITVVAIGISVWSMFMRDTNLPLAPDYAPREIEENAKVIEDEDPVSKMEASEGGGAVSLTYSKEVVIDLSDRTVTLVFNNPSKSTQDMVLQLAIQDTVVLQSGRLTPGKRVTKLALLKGMEKVLSPGGYDGQLVVFYYDQKTAEKSILNTQIPVTITVQE